MSIASKLYQVYQAYQAIKTTLINKSVATNATKFSTFHTIITNNLSTEPPTITLTLSFNNKMYYQTTVGSKTVYASSSSYKSTLLVNDEEYFSLLKGKAVVNGTSQPTQSISVQVPQNSKVTIKYRLYIGATSSSPSARRCYDSGTNLYSNNLDTKTVTVETTNKTVTFSPYADSDGLY